MVGRPSAGDYAPFYGGYVRLVPEDDVLAAMAGQLDDALGLLRSVSEAESTVRHAPYRWSTREVVGHMADAERIFAARALRFARADPTPLPGFDEAAYMEAARFDRRELAGLVDEFEAVRRSSLLLFRHLDADAWGRAGEANGGRVTVRALASIVVGHARHHTAILRSRFSKP